MPLTWLFDTTEFITRSHCGPGWTPVLRWIYLISNGTIAVAYFVITAGLLYLYKKQKENLHQPKIMMLFGIFIGLCGLTHVTDVLVFTWAPYRLYTLIFFLTAVFSIRTAILMPSVVVYLSRMKSREFVHSLNDQLNAEILLKQAKELAMTAFGDELQAKLAYAEDRIKQMEADRGPSEWWRARKVALAELDAKFVEIKSEICGE